LREGHYQARIFSLVCSLTLIDKRPGRVDVKSQVYEHSLQPTI